jgi:phage gp29-like protein
MVQILDQFGRPIERATLSEPQSARLGHLAQEFATHPSRGLTPQKLARILEEAELGDIVAQHDLFLDMEEKDGHIYAEMSKRKRALLTLDWDIIPPRNASSEEQKTAAYVKELILDIPNLEDVMLDALDGVGHGFSCLEYEWQLSGREWLPKSIKHRPQSWFQPHPQNRNQLRLRDYTPEGAELQPFGWIVHTHRAKSGYLTRGGLHRVLAWPYLFKNYSVRDLAEFLEIYGLPLRLGKYGPGASDTEKATLLRAVAGIGHNAAAIIPEGMTIEFEKAAEGQQDPFEAMISWCERTQSKAILGGTLTSQADGASSTNALGNVHNEVRHDLLVSDATQLGGTLTRDIVFPLLAINKGVPDPRRMPRLAFDTREPEDLKLYAESLPKLVGIGVQVPVNWAQDKLRIPAPKENEKVLVVPQPEMTIDPSLRKVVTPKPDNPASARVALKDTTGETRDEFDVFSDDLAGEWERVTDPLISPIERLAAECSSYEEFQRRLPEAIDQMDTAALTEAIAKGNFAAYVFGRVSGN